MYANLRIMPVNHGLATLLATLLAAALLLGCSVWCTLRPSAVQRFYASTADQPDPLRDARAYVINLDTKPDRLRNFMRLFGSSDAAGVAIERVPAVVGNGVEARDYLTLSAFAELAQAEDRGYRERHYQLTRGAIGCYLSHMEVLRRIAGGVEAHGLVFEDDAIVPKDLLRRARTCLRKVPEDWDLFLLDYHCYDCSAGPLRDYLAVRRFMLTDAYVVTKRAAVKALEYLESIPIEQQVDAEMSHMSAMGLLKIYAPPRRIVRQDGGFTTNIQTLGVRTTWPWAFDALKPVAVPAT
jgi:GR25 family glycosyltransferase involved in LPS biosynthesis